MWSARPSAQCEKPQLSLYATPHRTSPPWTTSLLSGRSGPTGRPSSSSMPSRCSRQRPRRRRRRDSMHSRRRRCLRHLLGSTGVTTTGSSTEPTLNRVRAQAAEHSMCDVEGFLEERAPIGLQPAAILSEGMGGTLDVSQGAAVEWLLTVSSMILRASAWQLAMFACSGAVCT